MKTLELGAVRADGESDRDPRAPEGSARGPGAAGPLCAGTSERQVDLEREETRNTAGRAGGSMRSGLCGGACGSQRPSSSRKWWRNGGARGLTNGARFH